MLPWGQVGALAQGPTTLPMGSLDPHLLEYPLHCQGCWMSLCSILVPLPVVPEGILSGTYLFSVLGRPPGWCHHLPLCPHFPGGDSDVGEMGFCCDQ